MFTPNETLEAIRGSDPDGWETREPTDADRSAFHAWVIRTHGREAWKDYLTDWEIVEGFSNQHA